MGKYANEIMPKFGNFLISHSDTDFTHFRCPDVFMPLDKVVHLHELYNSSYYDETLHARHLPENDHRMFAHAHFTHFRCSEKKVQEERNAPRGHFTVGKWHRQVDWMPFLLGTD